MEEKTIDSIIIVIMGIISLFVAVYYHAISEKKPILEKFKLGCSLFTMLIVFFFISGLIIKLIKSFFM